MKRSEQAHLSVGSPTMLEFEKDPKVLEKKVTEFLPGIVKESPIKLMVCDLDEVLVRICPKWLVEAFKVGMVDEELVNPLAVDARTKYNISEYMGVSQEEALRVYDTLDFYDDLVPTKLGAALSFASSKEVIKLAIVSHNTPRNLESKRRFCKKFWPRASRFFLPLDQPKSDIINEKGLGGYCTFCDDSVAVMCDVVANTDPIGKEFLMPLYGYNGEDSFPDVLIQAMAESGATLRYYSPSSEGPSPVI